MKQRVSIVLDEETLKLVEEALQDKTYRNRSHAIEFILNKFLKTQIGEEGE